MFCILLIGGTAMKLNSYKLEGKFIYAFLIIFYILAFLFSILIPTVLWPDFGIIKKLLIMFAFMIVFAIIIYIIANVIEKIFNEIHVIKGQKTYMELNSEIEEELRMQLELANTPENRMIRIERNIHIIISMLGILLVFKVFEDIDLTVIKNVLTDFIIRVAAYFGIVR